MTQPASNQDSDVSLLPSDPLTVKLIVEDASSFTSKLSGRKLPSARDIQAFSEVFNEYRIRTTTKAVENFQKLPSQPLSALYEHSDGHVSPDYLEDKVKKIESLLESYIINFPHMESEIGRTIGELRDRVRSGVITPASIETDKLEIIRRINQTLLGDIKPNVIRTPDVREQQLELPSIAPERWADRKNKAENPSNRSQDKDLMYHLEKLSTQDKQEAIG